MTKSVSDINSSIEEVGSSLYTYLCRPFFIITND